MSKSNFKKKFWENESLLNVNSRICGSHPAEKFLVVFADEGLLVIAGDVMPGHSVVVEVVQHRQAGFVVLTLS
jgi:hypothetical protein